MSVAELKDALREALERRGVLDQLRANVRSEVFRAMEDTEEAPPELTGENMLINELIREYLAFNNYKHTLAVFSPEVGLPAEPLRRQYVAQQTRLPVQVGNRRGTELPLLYALTSSPPSQPQFPVSSQAAPPQNVEPSPATAPPLPYSRVQLAPPSQPHHAAVPSMAELMSDASARRQRQPEPTPVIFTAPP